MAEKLWRTAEFAGSGRFSAGPEFAREAPVGHIEASALAQAGLTPFRTKNEQSQLYSRVKPEKFFRVSQPQCGWLALDAELPRDRGRRVA